MNDFDNVKSSGISNNNKPSITFEKNLNGNTIVVTYISDKHHNLEVQTMYKFKNNKGASATGINATNALVTTSKTNSGTNTPNKSITQNQRTVKNDTAINKQFMLNNNDYSHYYQKWKDKFKPSETNSNMLPEKHYNKLLDIGVDKNLIDYIGTNDIYNGYGKDRAYKTVTEYENIAKRNLEISEKDKQQEEKDALNLKNRIIEEKARESKYIQEYGITENQYKKLREAEIFRENNSSFRIVLF